MFSVLTRSIVDKLAISNLVQTFKNVKYSIISSKICNEDFLSKYLYTKIVAKGPISVADYMKDVLQSPVGGYYISKDMLGESGDFVTSPEISQTFGEMIAIWLLNEWCKLGSPSPLNLVELGPGRGTLSNDILKVLNHFKVLQNTSMHLVEISPVLSEIQSKLLCVKNVSVKDPQLPHYREGISKYGIPIKWYKELKDVPHGFSLFWAHEFFDALPIHKFKRTYSGYKEVLIDLVDQTSKDDIKFRFVLAREATPMQKLLIRPTENRTDVEISPESMVLYEQLCIRIVKDGGIVLICDYGHNGTGTDTFRAYRNHKQVDPLILPGTADLTADVDFSLIEEACAKNGEVIYLGPVTQKYFLHSVGIEHRIKSLSISCDHEKSKNLQKCYKYLTEEMGQRFKFCAVFPKTTKQILQRLPVVGF